MAIITHTCAQCGKQLTIPERYQGRNLKCPECGDPFRVEPESAAAVSAPLAPAPPPAAAPQAMAGDQPAGAARPAPWPSAQPPAAPVRSGDDPFYLAEPAPRGATPPVVAPVTVSELPLEPTANARVYWSLTRVDVLSTAKVAGIVYAALGVVAGILISLAALAPRGLPFLPLRGGIAFIALLGAPVIYGAIGFVAGALLAALYNFAARLTGGISFLLE